MGGGCRGQTPSTALALCFLVGDLKEQSLSKRLVKEVLMSLTGDLSFEFLMLLEDKNSPCKYSLISGTKAHEGKTALIDIKISFS